MDNQANAATRTAATTVVHGNLATEERLRWLGQRLAAEGSVSISTAADSLGVSEMTVRRDLVELEHRGVARRVWGGATAVGPEPFADRHRRAARAKTKIAAKVAEIVPVAGTIAFDASSTVARLTSALGRARDLTILTNGPDTFAALQRLPGVHPLLTGGALDPRTGSLVGPLACRAARQLAVELFVTSAAALDPHTGTLEATLEEAEVKQSIAAGCREVVLAVDASKLGGRSAALSIEWDRVGLLVTELDPCDARLAPYRKLVEIR